MQAEDIYTNVTERYSSAANSSDLSHGKAIAEAFGYSESELSSIPEGANLGLSCGNPLAIATLREVSGHHCGPYKRSCPDTLQGETVIDLGSGAGFDVFLAADKVGATGIAIGIDMNKVGSTDRLCLTRIN